MLRTTAVLACAACVLTLYSPQSVAQAQQDGPWSYSFDGGGVHQDSTSLKDGGGGFDADRWFISAGADYAWNPRQAVGLRVGGGRSVYRFDADTGFGGGDPWSTVEDFRISAPMRFGVGQRGTAFLVPTVHFDKDKGADMGDSATYGLYAAVAWRIDETLTIGPGLGVFSRLEDGARIFPVLAIDWDITDRLKLETGSGLAASQGPGLTLSYSFGPHWRVGLTGRYEDQEFRLADNNATAPGGVGRDQSFPLVVSGTIKPNDSLGFSLFAGAEFAGELKLKDTHGEVVEASDFDPALIIGATFAIKF